MYHKNNDTLIKNRDISEIVLSNCTNNTKDMFVLVKRVRCDNSTIKIISLQSLDSQPIEPQKRKNRESSIKNKVQNKKCHQVVLPANVNENKRPCILQLKPQQTSDVDPTINALEDKSENNELVRDLNKISILPANQNVNIQSNILQQLLSKNASITVSQNDLNIKNVPSIQRNKTETNITSSSSQNNDIAAAEIIDTKYLPIKPKPPGYQGPTIVVNEFKRKRKPGCKEKENSALHACIVCDQKFETPKILLSHQRKFHQVRVIVGKTFECRVCGLHLATIQSRYKHEKRFHPDRQVNKPSFKCPECLLDFNGKKSINKHLSSEHSNFDLESKNISFNSREEFEKWKLSIEKDTTSQFIIRNRHAFPGFEKCEFICHRSSPIQINFKSTGKRKMKYKGSNKTGLFCPAFMLAKLSDTEIQVTYCLTHLGHECDIEHIVMSKRIESDQNCKLLRCRVCKKVFSLSTNRKKHEIIAHGLDAKYDLTLKCPMCFNVFPTRKAMMAHFSKSHPEISLKKISLTFESLKEFSQWKLAMEQETNTEYVLDQVYQKNLSSFRRFNCHLSGSGTNEFFCPATVLVHLNPNENTNVHVTYLSTHIGHSCENLEITNKSPLKYHSIMSECISITDGHNAAEKVFENVNVNRKDENTWIISSYGNETSICEVKQLNVDCNVNCKFKCSLCCVCRHQFACNCSVSTLKLLCIHIHIVCLKNNMLNENVIPEDRCLDGDMNYSEGDNIILEHNVLQKVEHSHAFNSLKEQALTALSSLVNEVKNCNGEAQLRNLIKGISSLKSKINSRNKSTQEKTASLARKESACHINRNQSNDLEKVIQVALHLENTYSTY